MAGNYYIKLVVTIIMAISLVFVIPLESWSAEGGKEIFGIPTKGTGADWYKNQSNPFYGGKNWNDVPEWAKRKGPGIPDSNTGKEFIKSIKPSDPHSGFTSPIKPRVPESIPGVDPKSVAGGAGGTYGRTYLHPTDPTPPVRQPFMSGGTSEQQEIYNRSIKEKIPHRAPPGGYKPPAGPSAPSTSGTPKVNEPPSGSGVGSTIGKVLIAVSIINSGYNIITSDNPKETAKDEATGLASGLAGAKAGAIIGGGIGGPLGAAIGSVIGGITGALSTNKGFAGWLAGNNKDQSDIDRERHEETAGPAMIAGEQKKLGKNIEELRKTGALEGILNPPSPGTAGGPIYIDKEKESYKERIEAEKEKERVEKEQIKGGLENLEKTGGLKDINPPSTGTAAGTQDIGSSKISDLRGSEAKTSKIDKEKLEKSPEGQKAGMELAQNTKVTDSYDKDRSRKSKQKTKEVQDTAGSTQKERGDVSQAEDQREKTKIKGQGEETDRAISSSKQEHISAEKAAEQARQTAIGTVIAGGLFGGLSSGVAIGLDNLFGTIGKGAGQQVSSNMGIQPKPSSTGAGNQATGGTTSAAGDPLPWTYSGTCNGTVKAKANFGAGGSVGCSYSGPSKITLNADGSVTGESSAGYWVEFSDSGGGTGCASKSYNTTFNGSHSNGSVNITGSSGSKLSGSYNANSLTYSGGRSGSSMSLGGGGRSATVDVSTSCTYTRVSGSASPAKPEEKKPAPQPGGPGGGGGRG